MKPPALHATTKVLPGKRIEIDAADLREGQSVDVFVVARPDETHHRHSLADFLESLPPSNRTKEEWQEFEREFQAERDAWDR